MKIRKSIQMLLMGGFLLAAAACTQPPAAVDTPIPIPETAGATQPVRDNQLADTEWMLTAFGPFGSEEPVVPGTAPTLVFEAPNRAGGHGGCNTFGGQYQEFDYTVTFSAIASTKMACADPAAMQQEQAYLDALGRTGSFVVDGDTLMISYEDGQNALRFVRGTREPTAETTEAATAAPTTEAAPPATSPVEPTQAPAVTPQPGADYLDDRSTAVGLIQSYFNAINRHEYLRAYSYWRDPASEVGPFDEFEAGYQDTESVEITFGQIGGDAGAGQMYYSAPVLLETQLTSGETETYIACYILHLSNPGIQAEPPFRPLAITQGEASPAADPGQPASTLLANACADLGLSTGNPLDPIPTTDPDDISMNNYLDDRSSPEAVLKSLFNAVNSKEYARAYSYWEDPETNPEVPSFDEFAAGYAETESVQVKFGEITGDAGAGQFYYSVPVVLTAQTTGGEVQTFAGCYVVHQSSPGAQATPPFRPMAIRSADVLAADNSADPAVLLSQACPNTPPPRQ